MKGVLLAGGSGTRLYPLTKTISKHFLAIHDKPMIYYSLSILMMSKIREIIIVTTSRDLEGYKNLLGNGSSFGISIEYAIQDEPKGITHAVLCCEKHLQNNKFCLVLGDNIFYGQGLPQLLQNESKDVAGCSIFCYSVSDPENFGVVEIGKNKKPVNIAEKPRNPKSNLAVTGLYFFDEHFFSYAKALKPSARGEYEITSVINKYLEKKKLKAITLSRGYAWLDTGTFAALQSASNFIETVQSRQGMLISSPEEIALNNRWIDKKFLSKNLKKYGKNSYTRFLQNKLRSCEQTT